MKQNVAQRISEIIVETINNRNKTKGKKKEIFVTSLDGGEEEKEEKEEEIKKEDIPKMIGRIAMIDELRTIQVDGMHTTMWESIHEAVEVMTKV